MGEKRDQQREECIIVKKSLELGELPDVPDENVYILPGDWMEKWKAFNNYNEFMETEQKTSNFMEEENNKVEWLGPIDPSNILVNEPQLIDPRPEEFYTNCQVKPGLVENQDFFIINHKFWDYLYLKYGGFPIQRPTYRKLETSHEISVEIWLQKVISFYFPNYFNLFHSSIPIEDYMMYEL